MVGTGCPAPFFTCLPCLPACSSAGSHCSNSSMQVSPCRRLPSQLYIKRHFSSSRLLRLWQCLQAGWHCRQLGSMEWENHLSSSSLLLFVKGNPYLVSVHVLLGCLIGWNIAALCLSIYSLWELLFGMPFLLWEGLFACVALKKEKQNTVTHPPPLSTYLYLPPRLGQKMREQTGDCT